MSLINKISDTDIKDLENMISILSDPTDQRKFDAIHEGLAISAKYIWIMYAIPKLGVTEYIGANAGTVRRFFNETVEFIEGKSRLIRIDTWNGIIRDIARQYDLTQQQLGNVGSQTINKPIQRSGLSATSVGHKALDRSLLSYAHYVIIEKWLIREDGIYDMLKSILLLASIYKRYYPNADGNSPTAKPEDTVESA